MRREARPLSLRPTFKGEGEELGRSEDFQKARAGTRARGYGYGEKRNPNGGIGTV